MMKFFSRILLWMVVCADVTDGLVSRRFGKLGKIPVRSSSTCCGLATAGTTEYGPFQEGRVVVLRTESSSYKLYYRVYNAQSNRTPLVIVHGGPSLPSQYLYPIVPLLAVQRPIIFYDQLGCGKSDKPRDRSCYSIPQFVWDLESVLEQVLSTLAPQEHQEQSSSQSFHLFGHSFGVCLAYEYLRRHSTTRHSAKTTKCRSVVLCNAIANMAVANDNYDRLAREAGSEDQFWRNHCSRTGIPPALQDALRNTGTFWGGMDAVGDYVAQPLVSPPPAVDSSSSSSTMIPVPPPVLLLSGWRDFGYPTSNKEVWSPLLSHHLQVYESVDWGHYPFYEDPITFGSVISGQGG